MCPNFVFQNHSTYVSIGAVDLGKKIPGLGSALSLFALSLKIAHCKEQLERFAHVALYKRATMSDSLMLIFTKERRERIALIAL